MWRGHSCLSPWARRGADTRVCSVETRLDAFRECPRSRAPRGFSPLPRRWLRSCSCAVAWLSDSHLPQRLRSLPGNRGIIALRRLAEVDGRPIFVPLGSEHRSEA